MIFLYVFIKLGFNWRKSLKYFIILWVHFFIIYLKNFKTTFVNSTLHYCTFYVNSTIKYFYNFKIVKNKKKVLPNGKNIIQNLKNKKMEKSPAVGRKGGIGMEKQNIICIRWSEIKIDSKQPGVVETFALVQHPHGAHHGHPTARMANGRHARDWRQRIAEIQYGTVIFHCDLNLWINLWNDSFKKSRNSGPK